MKLRAACAGGLVLAGFAASGVAGCIDEPLPLGHIVLYIDTDAPLPSAPGVIRAAGAPPPLFDRVRIDLYREGESEPCDGCSREFDIDEESVNAGASIVLLAGDAAGTAPRARVLLYRGAVLSEPAPAVEVDVQLPELPAEGTTTVTAFLPTDALGVPMGSLDAPILPQVGWSGAGHAGTWPPAQPVPCTRQARAGEVCVPGGAFWMGDRTFVDAGLQVHLNAERIVVLAPFFIDSTEVTVRDYRDAGGSGALQWSGDYGGSFATNQTDYCTFTASAERVHDRLPVNCIGPGAAAAYCAARGSALPTEAQFEYVEGALASRAHPWGEDEPTCTDAIWGRLGELPQDPTVTGDCYDGKPPSPEPLLDESGAFRPGRDRVELDAGTVYDLAGNVSEWTSDIANQPGEPCWPTDGSQIFVDPSCHTVGEQGVLHTIRGGDFVLPAYWTRAASRWAGFSSLQTGFRCARPDSDELEPVDCTGLVDGGAEACDRCVEQHCCSEFIDSGGVLAGAALDCASAACARTCGAFDFATECGAPQALAPTGTCVTLGGAVECNPVTNEGCDTAANSSCDNFEDGFVCFGPPNDAPICAACDTDGGPFCSPGSTCIFGPRAGCIKYCCEDSECGPGYCFHGDGANAVFPSTPGLGLCASSSAQ